MNTFLIIVVLMLAGTVGMLLRKPKKTSRLTVKDLSAKARVQAESLAKVVTGAKKVTIEAETKGGLIYVLNFKGDLTASQVESLREEVNAILMVKAVSKVEEVIVRLKSPGGTVPGYGLAAAQLARIRQASIPLTVTVDEMAASGGYMMAAVADKIVSAPFSVIGSVGVAMEMPNVSRLLAKLGVEYKQYTAGEHKRPISPFTKPTLDGEEKTREKLADTHELFKKHIKKYREKVDVEKISTGETWYGEESLKLNLVDEIKTSDEYLEKKLFSHKVLELKYVHPEKLSRKLTFGLAKIVNLVGEYWLAKLHREDVC